MRKISISGKGGTGKSTLTSLLSYVLSEKGYTVFTIDSDESNPGLYRMLGFNQSPKPLMDLFGGEKEVSEEIKRRSANAKTERKSEWLKRDNFILEEVPGEYIVENDNLKLMTVGKITTAFEGCSCPMAEVIKLFLEKLILKENEIVLVDMEAGVEHFGRGVDKSLDVVLIPVEPSFESAALAMKISILARQSGIRDVWAVLNKIPSQAVKEKLQERLNKTGVKVIGTIHNDPVLSETSLEGKPLRESQAKEEVRGIVASLLQNGVA
ncbi:MAG: P-loop NTPase [Dehalococcoidales bacterium]|nr:P-loop NTPase [Dehalococcoidales bacterium]